MGKGGLVNFGPDLQKLRMWMMGVDEGCVECGLWGVGVVVVVVGVAWG